MNKDLEHLKLLSIFHYVVAAITALFGCFPLLHVGMGMAMLSGAFDSGPNPPPLFIGWFFIAIGGTIIISFWALAIAMLLNAVFLGKRKNRIFCFVVAGIECTIMPFGTVLGIFTIIVLMRDSVKALFASNQPFR